jgi:transposase
VSTTNQNVNGSPSVPTVLPGDARREAERSEADRSAAPGKTVAGPGAGPAVRARPDPEVVVDAKRRTFTAGYKLRILAEAEEAKKISGGVGTLLRREGLYSSHLVFWRRERDAASLEGMSAKSRGPKPNRNPLQDEVDKLRRENQGLCEELRKAEIVIEVQKKIGGLLGWTTPPPSRREIS